MFRVNGEEASERARDRPAWYHGHIEHENEDRAGWGVCLSINTGLLSLLPYTFCGPTGWGFRLPPT